MMSPREHNHNALRTWIDVDVGALAQNYKQFRSLLSSDTQLCVVVKSNAYGHSLVDYAKEMEKLGADRLAVDSVIEGLRLREEGIKSPLMVLGYTLPDMLKKASENDIAVTVSSFSLLESVLSYQGEKPLKIHLKFDTGMNRQGFQEEQTEEVVSRLSEIEDKGLAVNLEGLYTHFADAKNPSEPKHTRKQIESFERIKNKITDAGFQPVFHAGATSTTIIFPEAHYDMVRVGIGMYGLWPSEATRLYAQDKINLKPALSWKTVVGEVKEVSAGSQFGYGLTESVVRDSKVAVLPIGYWHGYSRSFSSISQVLIKGKRAKVLGTISMDITVVDVTDVPEVSVGDKVTLIGENDHEEISADELAGMIGTINYEVVTRINPLIKRFYNLADRL